MCPPLKKCLLFLLLVYRLFLIIFRTSKYINLKVVSFLKLNVLVFLNTSTFSFFYKSVNLRTRVQYREFNLQREAKKQYTKVVSYSKEMNEE